MRENTPLSGSSLEAVNDELYDVYDKAGNPPHTFLESYDEDQCDLCGEGGAHANHKSRRPPPRSARIAALPGTAGATARPAD